MGPAQRKSETTNSLIEINQNRTWLQELAAQLPVSIRFDGFDGTKRYHPHDRLLFVNIALNITDTMKVLREDLVERYDVVHVRFFTSTDFGTNPVAMLSHCIGLEQAAPSGNDSLFDTRSSAEPVEYLQ